MARLVWAEPALLDPDEIAGYIALDNSAAAKRLVQRVFDRVDLLKVFPDSGRRPPELPESRYNSFVWRGLLTRSTTHRRTVYRSELNPMYATLKLCTWMSAYCALLFISIFLTWARKI